jgi:hypothetical protein
MQGEGSSNTGQPLTEADKKQIGKDQPKADHIAEEYARIATHCNNNNIDMGWFDFIKIPPPYKADVYVDPKLPDLRKIQWDVSTLYSKIGLGDMFSLCFKMLEIAPKEGISAKPTRVKTVFRAKSKFLHVDRVKRLHPGVVWLDQETSMEDAAAACMRVLDISAQVTEHFLKLRLVEKFNYDSEFRLLSSHSL